MDRIDVSRKRMIRSFRQCLDLWMEKSFSFSTKHTGNFIDERKLTTIFQDVPEAKLPKRFKHLLCSNFSSLTEQSMPAPDFPFVPIKNLVAKQSRSSYCTVMSRRASARRYVACWNLLQCKSLAAEVSSDFIQEALTKHHETMQKQPDPLSTEVEEGFREFVKPFIRETIRLYDGKTTYPTNHSCVGYSRSEGGQLSAHADRLHTSSGRHVRYGGRGYQARTEPVVVTLEGSPGSGKSTMLRPILKELQRQFNLPPDSVYYRSAATDHWDGYWGQPITVIDDIGAYAAGALQISDDLKELLQLVSECEYVLPMADLKDKGRRFTSPFLILTTNHAARRSPTGFACPAAVTRRFGTVYRVIDRKIYDTCMITPKLTGDEQVQSMTHPFDEFRRDFTPGVIDIRTLVNRMRVQFDEFHGILRQEVSGLGLSLTFQKEDLSSKLNTCEVTAIPEPLKVRVITRPEPLTYALKPIQRAMFGALKKWKCFTPCWDPEYDLNQLLHPSPGDTLLSGDYTAATDDLHPRLSQIVGEMLIESLGPGFLSDLIRWESGPHFINYPESSKLTSVYQTNGQLMGSLLSFPILCLANAFTMCRATGTSLEQVPAVFHGDDIAAVATLDQIQQWEREAANVGLSLSLGKNYVSTKFVSIDSQLFLWEEERLVRKQTGKFRLVNRDASESCFEQALKQGFRKETIRAHCKDVLAGTYRSLEISVDQGGLGIESTRELTLWERCYYLYRVERKTACKSLGEVTQVPKELVSRLRLQVADKASVPEEKPSEKNVNKAVWRLMRRCERDSRFYSYVKQLSCSRPLSTFRSSIVRCDYSPSELSRVYGRMFPLR